MPETGGDGANEPPRTLAEKLSRLREARAPEGGRPPSWDALAKQIADATGVAVSGAYLWELGTGKPGTNVTLKHLKAFSEFFGRRVSYFVDDEVAFEDDAQAQLALLEQLRRLGVKQIRLQNMEGDAGPEAVTDLLGRLQTLDILRDTDVRDIALQVTRLTAEQREALGSLASKPSLLDALPRTIGLLEAATGLTDEQITSATWALGQPDAFQALQDEGVLKIARQCHELLPSSRDAVLSMIAQLGRLESGKA
ncbi:hypothetical protein SALBM311S_00642 [Streptomyces alboniger]|uniref:hypothetical protein n=1 Tax=Streptomyces TaxID=1883 RepID=UPI00165CCA2F|nr:MULTISPECIES: hypothetical protein [Streptomyces]MBC9729681.1 hypothetical protein [Streptomyces sp. TRM68367]MDQ0765676.1 transcriptional regulator with XRE-family HTH domain [Streptomyces canus]